MAADVAEAPAGDRLDALQPRRQPPAAVPADSRARVDLDAHIRCFAEPDWAAGGVGRKGWSRPDLNVLYPREASQVTAVPACAPLWHLRELPELAITSDARGFSRLGANYWERFSGGWFVPAVLYVLYPGKAGVEGGVQLEMLREGLQECEARIALEQKDPAAGILKQRHRRGLAAARRHQPRPDRRVPRRLAGALPGALRGGGEVAR